MKARSADRRHSTWQDPSPHYSTFVTAGRSVLRVSASKRSTVAVISSFARVVEHAARRAGKSGVHAAHQPVAADEDRRRERVQVVDLRHLLRNIRLIARRAAPGSPRRSAC